MRRISLLLLAPAALMLTGCGFIDNPWGSSKREIEETERLAEARAVKVPIQSVQRAEIGRTRNGFLITAYGAAPGFGYTFPVLQPRREGAPGIDGYVDYDFMATEPQPDQNLPQGATDQLIRADLPVDAEALRGVVGIRIHALSGGAQIDFDQGPSTGS